MDSQDHLVKLALVVQQACKDHLVLVVAPAHQVLLDLKDQKVKAVQLADVVTLVCLESVDLADQWVQQEPLALLDDPELLVPAVCLALLE